MDSQLKGIFEKCISYQHIVFLFFSLTGVVGIVSASILDASSCHDDCYLFDINPL